MSIAERLAKRANYSTSVDVEVEFTNSKNRKDKDKFVFVITRIPKLTHTQLAFEAAAYGNHIGENTTASQQAFTFKYTESMINKIQELLTDWTHTPKKGDAIPYAKDGFKQLIETLDFEEVAVIVGAYDSALQADAGQAEKNLNGSGGASVPDLKNVSATT